MANRSKRTRSSSGETLRTERLRSHSWSVDEEGGDVHKRGYRSSSTTDINNNRTNRGRSKRRGRSRSWFNNKSSSLTKKKRDKTNHHPPRCGTLLVSPPGTVPSPRLDVWVVFAASSCACLVSLVKIHADYRSSDFNGWDILALTTCCLSFVIGLAMALGMRVGPSRMWFTQPLGRERRRQQLAGGGRGGHDRRSCVADLTLELLLLSFLLFLWMLSISTLVDGTSTGGGGDDYDIIWNVNLFYSSWTTFLLCTYLWVEVLTSTDRGGVITIAKTQEERLPSNTFTKRWTLLLFVSLVIFSASIATYTGPMCRGSILKSTSYCSRSMSGILIGGLFQCLMVLCVAILYRLSHMRRRNRTARNARDEARDEQFIASTRIRDRGSCTIALTSLIAQCIHVALVTSPTGGGPGNDSGTLYFGSWLGFVSSFELCLRYLEFYTTVTTTITAIDDVNNDIPKRVEVDRREGSSSDDVTVYEESKSEGDSPLGNASVNKRKDKSSIFPGSIDASLVGGKENNWPLPTAGMDPVATPEVPIKQSVQVKDSTRKVKRNRKDSPGRSSTQQRKDGRPTVTANKSFRPDPVPANKEMPTSRSVLPATQQGKTDGRPNVTSGAPLRPDPASTSNKRSNRNKPVLSSMKVDRTRSARENMISSDKEDTHDPPDRHFFDKKNVYDHHLPKSPSVSINVFRSTSIREEELTSYPTFQKKELSLLRKNSESLKLSPSKQSTLSNKEQVNDDCEVSRSKRPISVDREISLNSSYSLGEASVEDDDASQQLNELLLSMSNSLDMPVRRRVPPPPPFRQTPTPESYHCPLQSIYTSKGKSFLSEPTLDSGLTKFPKSGPRSTDSTRKSTDSTYEKKLSDETERHDSYSDDDSLRLEPGDNKKFVDSIVATALAYAERHNSTSKRSAASNSKRASVSTTATSKSVWSMYSDFLQNEEDASLDEQYDC